MCLAHQARRDKARQDGGGKPHVGHQRSCRGAVQTRLLQRSRKRGWQAGSQRRWSAALQACEYAKFLCRELLALWSLSVQSFETLRSDHAAPMQCGGA